MKKRKGITLVEIVIAIVLMSMLAILAVQMINLGVKGYTGAQTQIGLAREDSAFALKLNETIRKSTATFTVPEKSFNVEKLTAGWNYLGVMDGVHIPESCSRTGKEISSAKALVYVEYIGVEAPSSVPADCNLLKNEDGYFFQKILGHAFVDTNGIAYDYSLVFYPTDPVNTAAQSITYKFNSEIKNIAGEDVGDGTGMNVESMLNVLNAIQVVYKGSAVNPAVALAFRSDFLPTYSVGMINTNKPAATVVMVLDVSGSMTSNMTTETGGRMSRINALKKAATEFADELAKNDKVNVIVVPFSSYGGYGISAERGSSLIKWSYNASAEHTALLSRINGLNAGGNTNVGDGLRRAYYEIQNLKNTGVTMGTIFTILMTDGAMNEYSCTDSSQKNFYYGDALVPPFYNTTVNYYVRSRQYATYWGEKIVNEYNTTNYLISLCDGMGTEDKKTLEAVFGTKAFDVHSLTDFTETFEQINANINDIIWAFEGPKL